MVSKMPSSECAFNVAATPLRPAPVTMAMRSPLAWKSGNTSRTPGISGKALRERNERVIAYLSSASAAGVLSIAKRSARSAALAAVGMPA